MSPSYVTKPARNTQHPRPIQSCVVVCFWCLAICS